MHWRDQLMQAVDTGDPLDALPGISDRRIEAHEVNRPQIQASDLRSALLSDRRTTASQIFALRGFTIVGELKLVGANLPATIEFDHCNFTEGIDLSGSSLGALDLGHCEIHHLALHDATISRSFFADYARVNSQLKGWRLVVGGHVSLVKAKLGAEDLVAPLDLMDARIGGHLILAGAAISGLVDLAGVQVEGGVILTNAKVKSDRESIRLSDCRVGRVQGPFLEADGTFDFGGAIALNGVDLSSSRLGGIGDTALNISGAEVGQGLDLTDAHLIGNAWGSNVRISGDLRIRRLFMTATSSTEPTMFLDGMKVDGSIYGEQMVANGQVWLASAAVRGGIYLHNAQIRTSNDDSALNLRFVRCEEVNLMNSHLAGGLDARSMRDCDTFLLGGVVAHPQGVSAAFRRANIGELSIIELLAEGTIGLDSVRAKSVNLVSTQVANTDYALDLTEAEITTGIVCRNLILDGFLVGQGADFGKYGVFDGLNFLGSHSHQLKLTACVANTLFLDLRASEGEHSISLGRSRIGRLRIEGVAPYSTLDLRAAAVDLFSVPGNADSPFWTSIPDLDGWKCGSIESETRVDHKTAMQWLGSSSGLSPQAWDEMARVYANAGRTDAARALRIEKAWREAREGSRLEQLRAGVYGALVGHGFRPALTVLWMALLVAIGTALGVQRPEEFSPVSSSMGITGASPVSQLPAGTGPFVPIVYSLVTVTPASALMAPQWAPTSVGMIITFTCLKFAGWLLTALLLAGWTGLLRRV